MTIAVSVKVGEGLVVAADSMSSYFDNGILAQSYNHARKLLQLSDYPVGILTYGLGDVSGRNLESLLAEFEQTISTYAEAGSYTVWELARWWGQTRPIERLYLGCDTAAIDWFVDNGVTATDAVQYYTQLRDRLMWPIIYQGMPIQDAIDLAVYLVNVTIGHSRFAVGPPVCGGHIEVATVTSRGFRWVRQKDWVVKTDSVFF